MRSPAFWLAMFNILVAGFAGYVGLRLEPLYQRMEKLERWQGQYEELSRATINDYIAFKAQTIEILRQQNAELLDVHQEIRKLQGE